MEAQKKLGSPEQKHEPAQSVLATLEQHFHINLFENQVNRVMEAARAKFNSPETPREFREAILDRMRALLSKGNPERATELRAQSQGVAGFERIGIPVIAENEGANAAKAGSPKEAGARASEQNLMFLDPKHDQEIKRTLGDAAKAYFGKPFEDLKQLEKAELLLRAMRAPEFFNFQYVKTANEIPKLVEDTYAARSGNCDELTRLFLAIASKPEFGLANMSQFYVMLRSETTGKEFAHTAIFYVNGTVFFIDPALVEFKPFEKTFKSPDEVMKDKAFRAHLLELVGATTGEKGPFVIEEMARVKGVNSWGVSYYFNYGSYATQNNDWDKAIEYYTKVLDMGLATAHTYFALGQAHLNTDSGDRTEHYSVAEALFTKAIGIKADAVCYANRGFVRFQLGKYDLARQDFEAQLKLEPDSVSAVVGIGSAYVNIARSYLDKVHPDYADTLINLQKAQKPLFDALKRSGDNVDKNLSGSLEAFFTNYHIALTGLEKRTELEDLRRLYHEAQKFGFRSDEVDQLFK